MGVKLGERKYTDTSVSIDNSNSMEYSSEKKGVIPLKTRLHWFWKPGSLTGQVVIVSNKISWELTKKPSRDALM